MRWAVPQLPSDEVANIGRTQIGHGDAAAGELLAQKLPDDAAMVTTRFCRKAADITQVVVVTS